MNAIEFAMALQVCTEKLEQLKELFKLGGTFMLTICVLNLMSSFAASFANLLVVHALWKASSIPTNLRKLFLSLAFSDLAVGLIVQSMYGIIIGVMSRMAASGNYNFNFCPTPLAVKEIFARKYKFYVFLPILFSIACYQWGLFCIVLCNHSKRVTCVTGNGWGFHVSMN